MEEPKQSNLESPPVVPIQTHESYEVVDSRKGFEKDEFFAEVKRQLWLAGPLVTVNLFVNCLQVISVMFVGHLGELALAGASMATSFASVTGFTLLIGMASALDTFCGQSYRAKEYSMLGIHLQRACIVLLLVSIPLALVWANTENILVFLRQDPQVSAEAGLYARYMIPSIFASALLQCHGRFLQSQNNVVPMVISTGVTALLHLLVCWVLVFRTGLGSKGAALATATSYWINALFLVLYVRISPSCNKTWTGFSREAFHGILSFLKLAVPGTIMTCMEMWSFEMTVLLSGLLPNPKLETSVSSICLNTSAMIYMITLGLSAAVSIRVSNELGARRPQAARLAVLVSVFMVSIESILVTIALLLGRNAWGYAYSNELEVVTYVGKVLVFIAASRFFDGIQTVLSGALRGCGKQKLGAIVNVGSYYLMGIPAGIVLAFVYHIGGKGLWIGITIALFMQALLMVVITLGTNWEKEEKKATQRVYSSMGVETRE